MSSDHDPLSWLPPKLTLDQSTGRIVEVIPSYPAPELLTMEELIRYLRIDANNPYDTIRRYCKLNGIKRVRVGQRHLCPLTEARRLWQRLQTDNPV